MTVVCPSTGTAEPMFKDRQERVFTIGDPRLRAVAAKACEGKQTGVGDAGSVSVQVTNSQASTIYVSFTIQNGAPGPIAWTTGAGCTPSGAEHPDRAEHVVRGICADQRRHLALLRVDHRGTRQLLSRAGQSPDHDRDQLPGRVGTRMLNKGMPCVWYDISVIPSYCTDSAWASNQCAGTGGASYNLPVAVSCGGATSFTCQGPPTSTYGSEMYPGSCGNPNAQCTRNAQSCVNAYFFPMFTGTPSKYQPNVPCLSGQQFGIQFLSGP